MQHSIKQRPVWMQLFYPKQTDKPLYQGLVTQLKSLNIPMPSIDDIQSKPLREQFDAVVDSIFGFGFTGAPRPPFDKIIEVCHHLQSIAIICQTLLQPGKHWYCLHVIVRCALKHHALLRL